MSDEPKDQRIPIMMSASEVEAIDEWGFNSRIRSRAESIRRLCQLGMVFDRAYPALMKIITGPENPVRRDGTPSANEYEGALLVINKLLYELSKITLEVAPIKSMRNVDEAIAEAKEFQKLVATMDWRNKDHVDAVVTAVRALSGKEGLKLKTQPDQD